ncbi:MAG: LamB/YcsF family protein [Betaproteobacteria bacterium]
MTLAINCDMGEAFGLYKCGDDEGIMPFITMANVACGFHASDPVVMRKTVRLAKRHGVSVGAHPSYPDLQGFGRREMRMTRDELSACLMYQVGALKAFLDAEGMPLNHIKPHGALYGVAARDEQVANAIADVAEVFGVPLLGMARTQHETVYTKRGIAFHAEYYTDLDYNDDGSLIITREHVGKDPQEAANRSVRAVRDGKATSVNGKDIPMRADCICVHSDTPGAVELARAVRDALAPWLGQETIRDAAPAH